MFGVIYRITNTVNGKIYIGQTIKTVKARLACHKASVKYNLGRAIRKYGIDKFKIETIDQANSSEELDNKEIAWISKSGSIRPNGYNLTIGGDGHRVGPLPIETRAKIAKANLGKRRSETFKQSLKAIRSGKGNGFFGKKHTDETKRIIAEKCSNRQVGEANPFFGKKHSEETKQKIREANLGKTISAEIREKIGSAQRGKVISEEVKRKMSEGRKKVDHWWFRLPKSEEHKAKIAASKRGRKLINGKFVKVE